MAGILLRYSSFGSVGRPTAIASSSTPINETYLYEPTNHPGYIFHGWYTSEDYTTKIEAGNTWDYYFGESDSVRQIIIYAKWELSKVIVDEQYLYDIANAIREKNKGSDTYKPGEMGKAVRNLNTLLSIAGSTTKQCYAKGEGYSTLVLSIPPNTFVQSASQIVPTNYENLLGHEEDKKIVLNDTSCNLSRNFSVPKLKKLNNSKCILLYKDEKDVENGYYYVAIATYQNNPELANTLGTPYSVFGDNSDLYIYDIESFTETEVFFVYGGTKNGVDGIWLGKIIIHEDESISIEEELATLSIGDYIHEGASEKGGGCKILFDATGIPHIFRVSNFEKKITCYIVSLNHTGGGINRSTLSGSSVVESYSASYDSFNTELGGLLLDGLYGSNGAFYLQISYSHDGWFENIEQITFGDDLSLIIENISQTSFKYKDSIRRSNIIEWNGHLFYRTLVSYGIDRDLENGFIYDNTGIVIESYSLHDVYSGGFYKFSPYEFSFKTNNDPLDPVIEELGYIDAVSFFVADDRLFFIGYDYFSFPHLYEILDTSFIDPTPIIDHGRQEYWYEINFNDFVVLENTIVGLEWRTYTLDDKIDSWYFTDIILNSPASIEPATDPSRIIGITETTATSTEKGTIRTIPREVN